MALTLGLQVTSEIEALFDFMQHVYGLFGFEFRMELSTRPENYLGTIETWDNAEAVSYIACLPAQSHADCLHGIATERGPRQAILRAVGDQSRGRCFLRSQD